jgi:dihydrofolate reductase
VRCNPNARWWNPAGASFEAALAALGVTAGRIAVIGGTDVFGLFLGLFDAFHLSRAPNVWLPAGRPVFPQVPARRPEEVLAEHGLSPDPARVLDAERGLTLVTWRRRQRA